MPFFSRLHGHFARVVERFNTDAESRRRLDEERFRRLTEIERDARREAEFKEWQRPEQRPTSAETVFLSQFRSSPDRFFCKTREPMTMYDAWNGISLDKRGHLIAKAKKNEIYNTAKLAKFNKRCPLSPSVEDLSSTWASLSERDQENWLLTGPRRIALQSWKRYRFDHPRACGGSETPVPGTPFPIMDLPFELRMEIFSLVLSRSYPVLQFPSDGSADAFGGPVDVRLFAVSRQVFAEAVKIFYEVNTFGIKTNPSRYYKDIPLFIRQSTGDGAPRPTDSIKKVHVNIVIRPDTIETDEFLFLWKIFCEFLRTCAKLRKVGIAARWAQTFNDAIDEAIDLRINKLREMLRNMRRPKEAVLADVSTTERSGHQTSQWRVRRIVIVIGRSGEKEGMMSDEET
ncbi:MAG: hypothetical protein Q9175_004849 [Cornicularia normoerica]